MRTKFITYLLYVEGKFKKRLSSADFYRNHCITYQVLGGISVPRILITLTFTVMTTVIFVRTGSKQAFIHLENKTLNVLRNLEGLPGGPVVPVGASTMGCADVLLSQGIKISYASRPPRKGI